MWVETLLVKAKGEADHSRRESSAKLKKGKLSQEARHFTHPSSLKKQKGALKSKKSRFVRKGGGKKVYLRRSTEGICFVVRVQFFDGSWTPKGGSRQKR